MRRETITDRHVAVALNLVVAVARTGFILDAAAAVIWPARWPFIALGAALFAGALCLRRAARPGQKWTNSTVK